MTELPGGPPAPAAASRRMGHRGRRRWVSLLLGMACFLVYNANLRAISAGDTYPARYLPFALLGHHTLFLDPVADVAAQGRGEGAFWMPRLPDGHLLSLYPVILPVLVSPLYLPAVRSLDASGWTDARVDHLARVMEKLVASLLAALSAALLYRLLSRRAKPPDALLLTVAYAFGTTTWVVSSQALWQHGLGELLVVGALLMVTGPASAGRALAAGLLLGLLAGNRPPDAVLAAALGVFALSWAGRRWAGLLIAGALLPMAAVLLYNFEVAGNFFGGYGLLGHARFFTHPLLGGLAGLLVSPTRGLLVFSPFLVAVVGAWRHRPPAGPERNLLLALSAGIAVQLVIYAKADWLGGLSWGARYMTDLLPLLFWMLVPVVAALRGAQRAAFLTAVGVAIGVEAIGAFAYSPSLDLPMLLATHNKAPDYDVRAAWDWRHSPLLTSWRNGPVPGELLREVRGSFDQFESAAGRTSVIRAGEEAFAAGWALSDHATPWQVAVHIEGGQTSATRVFFPRPDVRDALREENPSGWRVRLETTGLAPGEHAVEAFAWSSEKGEGSFLAKRMLTVQ